MTSSRKTLRWICVLPAGIAAAALVSFAVHLCVMVSFGGWGVDPVIEIRDPNTLRSIEYVLQAAFGPLAFIYAAARTAPGHRMITSILLAGIILVGLPILTYLWNRNAISSGSDVLIEYNFPRAIANVIGGALAVYLTHLHQKEGS